MQEEEEAEFDGSHHHHDYVVKDVEQEDEEELDSSLRAHNLSWGILHPDQRVVDDNGIRVKWTSAEVQYVSQWLNYNYDSPVRLLYEDVHKCLEARKIFHAHHTDLERLSYMYKKLHSKNI